MTPSLLAYGGFGVVASIEKYHYDHMEDVLDKLFLLSVYGSSYVLSTDRLIDLLVSHEQFGLNKVFRDHKTVTPHSSANGQSEEQLFLIKPFF